MCLVEGNSLRATTRMTGTHRGGIQKLLVELGAVCSAYQDKVFRNLEFTRIQCDEIWAFVGCKQRNVKTTEHMRNGWGDVCHQHISTSFTERQNLTMRMSMRSFTRLTNAFSKKIENHEAAVALHFMHYNFARVHQTLRVTPAMEAGVSDHV